MGRFIEGEERGQLALIDDRATRPLPLAAIVERA